MVFIYSILINIKLLIALKDLNIDIFKTNKAKSEFSLKLLKICKLSLKNQQLIYKNINYCNKEHT